MLTEIIQELIEKAQASGKVKEKELKGGLHLHIRPGDSDMTLTLYRYAVYPSAQEWNIVIAHWPYPLGAINWSGKGSTKDDKHFMQAKIKTQGDYNA